MEETWKYCCGKICDSLCFLFRCVSTCGNIVAVKTKIASLNSSFHLQFTGPIPRLHHKLYNNRTLLGYQNLYCTDSMNDTLGLHKRNELVCLKRQPTFIINNCLTYESIFQTFLDKHSLFTPIFRKRKIIAELSTR